MTHYVLSEEGFHALQALACRVGLLCAMADGRGDLPLSREGLTCTFDDVQKTIDAVLNAAVFRAGVGAEER